LARPYWKRGEKGGDLKHEGNTERGGGEQRGKAKIKSVSGGEQKGDVTGGEEEGGKRGKKGVGGRGTKQPVGGKENLGKVKHRGRGGKKKNRQQPTGPIFQAKPATQGGGPGASPKRQFPVRGGALT